MKDVLNIYVDRELKKRYVEVCKKIGLFPSKRIAEFVKQDLDYINRMAERPLDVPVLMLKSLPQPKDRSNTFFNLTIEPSLKADYKNACEKIGSTASFRIGLFIEDDLKRLTILIDMVQVKPVDLVVD